MMIKNYYYVTTDDELLYHWMEERRIRLKWMDPSEQVELVRPYDVEKEHKCRISFIKKSVGPLHTMLYIIDTAHNPVYICLKK